jgi:hypothetical protein
MAPTAAWSSDRAPEFHMTPLMLLKKHKAVLEGEAV